MINEKNTWEQIATDGFCTMNPVVTRWACRSFLQETLASNARTEGNPFGSDTPVALKTVIRCLFPGQRHLLQRLHTAGADAHRVWLALREMHRRIKLHDDQLNGAM